VHSSVSAHDSFRTPVLGRWRAELPPRSPATARDETNEHSTHHRAARRRTPALALQIDALVDFSHTCSCARVSVLFSRACSAAKTFACNCSVTADSRAHPCKKMVCSEPFVQWGIRKADVMDGMQWLSSPARVDKSTSKALERGHTALTFVHPLAPHCSHARHLAVSYVLVCAHPCKSHMQSAAGAQALIGSLPIIRRELSCQLTQPDHAPKAPAIATHCPPCTDARA
jgi:hypothetical protein